MDFEKIISRQEKIGQIKNADFNIAFGIDKFYIPMMGILMTSLAKNNPSKSFCFHVFLDDMDDVDRKKFEKFCAAEKVQINFYYVLPDFFKNFYVDKGYSIAIFYRIIAAEFLARELDNLIYMDSDMLCLQSSEDFFQELPENILLAAVEDSGSWIPEHKQKINLAEDYKYFNTGILYLNLKIWREENISEKTLEILSQEKFLFPDQDALNIVVFRGGYGVKYVSDKFNYFFRVDGVEQKFRADVVIEHFAGQLKPWHAWCESDLKKIYEDYQKISEWRDFKYLPRNYQENRLMGRACRREGKYFEAFKWYLKYVEDKFFKK